MQQRPLLSGHPDVVRRAAPDLEERDIRQVPQRWQPPARQPSDVVNLPAGARVDAQNDPGPGRGVDVTTDGPEIIQPGTPHPEERRFGSTVDHPGAGRRGLDDDHLAGISHRDDVLGVRAEDPPQASVQSGSVAGPAVGSAVPEHRLRAPRPHRSREPDVVRGRSPHRKDRAGKPLADDVPGRLDVPAVGVDGLNSICSRPGVHVQGDLGSGRVDDLAGSDVGPRSVRREVARGSIQGERAVIGVSPHEH